MTFKPTEATETLRLAALLTVHNRREKTLACLETFSRAVETCGNSVHVDVYLVNDGCTDGTAEAVRVRFPKCIIIAGTGTLYWCGGMRLAWAAAAKAGGYDGYVWLNDDVVLKASVLATLLETESSIHKHLGRHGIVIGATEDSTTGKTSYGEMGPTGIIPAGEAARPIAAFNGNIVLVPDQVFRELGGLSRAYRHCFGDLDYACRARRHGVPIWLAPGHLGSCKMDKAAPWKRPDVPLLERLASLHRPTGCPPWELALLTMRNGGWWFPYTIAKLYWQAFFPKGAR